MFLEHVQPAFLTTYFLFIFAIQTYRMTKQRKFDDLKGIDISKTLGI